MSSADRLKRASKFLSFVLRHDPGSIGLKLDGGGWAEVDELLDRAAKSGRWIGRERLREVVATNDKQRFLISGDGRRIRASQGHSIPVDLALEPIEPPTMLYHGTAERSLESILRSGLEPRRRHHVHLSRDVETAEQVGRRHGKPAILKIDAARMHADGRPFYRSVNGVWLTDAVPPEYLSRTDDSV